MNAELMYRKRTELFLSRWKGARVQILKYGVGHSQLHVRIWNPDGTDELCLTCIDCEHICGSFSWDNCQIEVEYVGEFLDTQRCVVRDVDAGFTVQCSSANAVVTKPRFPQ